MSRIDGCCGLDPADVNGGTCSAPISRTNAEGFKIGLGAAAVVAGALDGQPLACLRRKDSGDSGRTDARGGTGGIGVGGNRHR